MNLNLYRIRMRHDQGVTTFHLPASDIGSAIQRMTDLERAPLGSVLSARFIRPIIHHKKTSHVPR